MNEFSLYRFIINILLNGKKVSDIGIGIGHYGIEYRRYSKQSIGIGHRGIVPSLQYVSTYITEETILNADKIISATRIFRLDPVSHHKVKTEMVKFTYDGPFRPRDWEFVGISRCGHLCPLLFAATNVRNFGMWQPHADQKYPSAGYVLPLTRHIFLGLGNIDKMCQLCGSPPNQFWLQYNNAGHNYQQENTGHTKIQASTLTHNQRMGKYLWGKIIIRKNTEINRPPTGLTTLKNPSSGIKRGPMYQ